jgi:hypothetical protein
MEVVIDNFVINVPTPIAATVAMSVVLIPKA